MSAVPNAGVARPTGRRRGRKSSPLQNALLPQLLWFIRLRWIAGFVVVLLSVADQRWLNWFAYSGRGVMLGLAILVYNLALQLVVRSLATQRRPREAWLLVAWVQLLLDLTCLTLLTMWTGGVTSPVSRFFVFHMVFASLLLPRTMAYGSAGAAVVMIGAGLRLTEQWPVTRSDKLLLLAQALTLLLLVYVANNVTRGLRRQRRRLWRQNQQIRQITRQLRRQQEALVQHEKMVAMGQMAAGITHEIANPLASMDSLLQLAQRKPEKLKPELLDTLRQQVSRIDQIIQQMKAFAHPRDAQQQSVNVNEVVEHALTMLRFDTRLKSVAVEKRFGADIGLTTFSPQALQQVLVNLIINAVDAMAGVEHPRLIIHTERRPGLCLIELSDNGHGIRREHMARLFEPFFTTKPVGKGTGLGLSISYSLVQKQGGTIAARSEVGKGTTFTIRLPITRAASEGTSANNSPASSAISREREAPAAPVAIAENPRP
jgi:signal transduction histidine kinase